MLKQRKPMAPGKGLNRTPPPREKVEVRPSSMKPSPCRMWDGVSRLSVPVPKRQAIVSKTLREAYRLLPCQFDGDTSAGICGREDGTVVCCHSNQLRDGKAMSQKADDSRAAAGCFTCHAELDQGKAWTKDERRERFDRAADRSRALLEAMSLWPAELCAPAASQATTED